MVEKKKKKFRRSLLLSTTDPLKSTLSHDVSFRPAFFPGVREEVLLGRGHLPLLGPLVRGSRLRTGED